MARIATWGRSDGTFYDSEEPESQEHVQYPLRPSDSFHWDGSHWVCRGYVAQADVGKAQHHVEELLHEPADTVLRVSMLRDVLQLLETTVETQQGQENRLSDIRIAVGDMSGKLSAHLTEAAPIIQAVKDLRSVTRLVGMLARLLMFVWKGSVIVLAVLGAIWALAHGDGGAVKRVADLLHSIFSDIGP